MDKNELELYLLRQIDECFSKMPKEMDIDDMVLIVLRDVCSYLDPEMIKEAYEVRGGR